ncbi:MAG: FKBP-type peptidyl-prolyl cis-trans isomerase [Alphaproteobacteria bacterium]|nr:FKBP-type peptidyl-prolyl cis-trans isomerase [Alphaproteobacteria bacterium]
MPPLRILALCLAAIASPLLATPAAQAQTGLVTSPSGLSYQDDAPGEGRVARAGDICVMHYTGWLYENGQKTRKFDSSRDRNQPFEFPLGAGRVIRGWDEGIVGMKEGGRRTLIIPAALGYGSRGAGGVIPPNATLLFEVELLRIR